MRIQEARDLGEYLAALVQANQVDEAYALLCPVLVKRTSFALLRRIGGPVGAGPLEPTNALLNRIAADGTEGGWVVIESALAQQLNRDLGGAIDRCRGFVIAADVWYAADTLGEGVAGLALVEHFQGALGHLISWRQDLNAWVRRAVGTSVHFWAKRSRGSPELASQAEALLALLEPMFGEWDITAVKGVGWGLKTLGKYYPDLLADWLAQEVVPSERRHRAVMLRKALTYLSVEQRKRATAKRSP